LWVLTVKELGKGSQLCIDRARNSQHMGYSRSETQLGTVVERFW
jgi:hypothetical protein